MEDFLKTAKSVAQCSNKFVFFATYGAVSGGGYGKGTLI